MYDDSGWEEVCLPHDWVTTETFDKCAAMNHGYKARKAGWYRLKFLLEEEARQKQLLIEFEGMSAEASIYVNGQLLYKNLSGYQGFCVDMTDVAHFGHTPNVVAVKIDASAWEGWWYEGAGIYRSVWMQQKAPVHSAWHGIFVEPRRLTQDMWDVGISHTLENSFEEEKEVTIRYRVLDGQRECVAEGSDHCFVKGYECIDRRSGLQVRDPKPWGLKSPSLYWLRTEIWYEGKLQDACENRFGFRTITFDGEKGFFLNRENVKIKGFCNHQDHAGVGVAVPYAVKEYRVRQLLKTGANAYRCAHNTDPEILDICDQLGMMVMEENRTFSTSPYAMEVLREMIREARNHPCVILYSLFNEEPWQGTEKGRRMAARMRACIRCEDAGRPVLGALNGGYMEEGARLGIDIMGMNYNTKMYDIFHEKYPQMPLIGSETASSYSVRGEYVTDRERHIIDNSDENCAPWGNTAREAWKMVMERPFVAGTFVWTGFDYRGEPTPFAWPSVASYFGVFDSCGFPKDAFWLYQAFWREEAVVHILPGWSLQGEPGTKARVTVFSNCEEVELVLDGRKIGERRTIREWKVCFEIPWGQGTLEALGYREGRLVAADRLEPCGMPVRLKLEGSKTVLWKDGLDAVVVNVYACDEKGHLARDADHMVEFQVSEGAYIAGTGNGNPCSQEPDLADRVPLFHGSAQVILRAAGQDAEQEMIKVHALACGLLDGYLEIALQKGDPIPRIRLTRELVVGGWRMYTSLLEEFPSLEKEEDYDQNSFEPVSFCGKPQVQYKEQYLKYGYYRTRLVLENGKDARTLVFPKVNGQVWIFMNGQCIKSRTDSYKGEIRVEIPQTLTGSIALAVIIRNMDWKWSETGVMEPVYLTADTSG